MRSAGADKMRRLCVPGSGSHRAPAPPTPGSYLTGNVFLKINLQTSQQAMHSKQKKTTTKTLIFVPKMWTCWLSILRTKLLLNFNLLLNNPDEQLWA